MKETSLRAEVVRPLGGMRSWGEFRNRALGATSRRGIFPRIFSGFPTLCVSAVSSSSWACTPKRRASNDDHQNYCGPFLFVPLGGLKISFSRFSRKICSFEKNVKSQKTFRIKFSTKMVQIKFFVAIILTKLQRFESTANATTRSGSLQSEADSGSPHRMVKTNVIFKVRV